MDTNNDQSREKRSLTNPKVLYNPSSQYALLNWSLMLRCQFCRRPFRNEIRGVYLCLPQGNICRTVGQWESSFSIHYRKLDKHKALWLTSWYRLMPLDLAALCNSAKVRYTELEAQIHMYLILRIDIVLVVDASDGICRCKCWFLSQTLVLSS